MAKAYVQRDTAVTGKYYVETEGGGDTPAGGIDYSIEEQDTGLKWIDGKSIYQRTFTTTTGDTGDNTTIANLTNIDTMVDMKGYIKGTGRTLNGYSNVNNYIGWYYSTETFNLFAWYPNAATFHGKEVTITIQYTKTE